MSDPNALTQNPKWNPKSKFRNIISKLRSIFIIHAVIAKVMQILTLGVLILSYNVCYILIDNNIMGGINVTNSNNLKMFRLNKRLSQKQLADKTGLSISSIAKIEQGVRNPSYKAADKICVVLDAPLEEVFPSYKRECPYPRTM